MAKLEKAPGPEPGFSGFDSPSGYVRQRVVAQLGQSTRSGSEGSRVRIAPTRRKARWTKWAESPGFHPGHVAGSRPVRATKGTRPCSSTGGAPVLHTGGLGVRGPPRVRTTMVAVAHRPERPAVDREVAGSTPASHPKGMRRRGRVGPVCKTGALLRGFESLGPHWSSPRSSAEQSNGFRGRRWLVRIQPGARDIIHCGLARKS